MREEHVMTQTETQAREHNVGGVRIERCPPRCLPRTSFRDDPVRYATSFLTLANGLRRSHDPISAASCLLPVRTRRPCSLARSMVV